MLISCGRPAVVCAVTDLRRLIAAAMEEAAAPKQAGIQSRHIHSGVIAELPHSSSPRVDGPEEQGAASTAPAGQQQLLQHATPSNGSTGHVDFMQGISERRESKAQTTSVSARPSGRKRLRQQLQAAEHRLVYFQSWANEQARAQYQHILNAVAEASQAFEHTVDLSEAPIGQLADIGNVHTPQASRMEAHQASGYPLLHKPLVQEYDGSTDDGATNASLRDGSSAQENAGVGAQYDTLE